MRHVVITATIIVMMFGLIIPNAFSQSSSKSELCPLGTTPEIRGIDIVCISDANLKKSCPNGTYLELDTRGNSVCITIQQDKIISPTKNTNSIPNQNIKNIDKSFWTYFGAILFIGILMLIILKIILGRGPQLPPDLEKTLNHNFKNLTGDQFELLVADLYRKKGYTVKKTPVGPDQGVDLFLTKKRWVGQKRIIVQVKNWQGPVGNSDILKTAGARQMQGASSALIITSSYFSKQALTALKNTSNIRGVEVEELKREFKKYFKTHPEKNTKRTT